MSTGWELDFRYYYPAGELYQKSSLWNLYSTFLLAETLTYGFGGGDPKLDEWHLHGN